MKSLIISVAGSSTRFNRDTKTDVLKCLYYEESAEYSLLYQQVCKVYDDVDEIIIVGGYKYDDLVLFFDNQLKEFKSKIKLIYNEHYHDYGSGYSLIKGLDSVSEQAQEVVFIEGDLFFDKTSLQELINSNRDVISINNETIKADKAVASYFDANHYPHYLYDTQHSCLSINEPFTAIYNSAQMWKFINVDKLQKIRQTLMPDQLKGTNLVTIQLYFEDLPEESIDIIQINDWYNCNTVDDYLAVYNHLIK